jgi:signal transduction histidine kinase
MPGVEPTGVERDRLLERLRAEQAAAQASARWARFLARSTAALAEAVGLDDTLARVNTLIVPALADVCEVLLRRLPEGASVGDGVHGTQEGLDGAGTVLESVSVAAIDARIQRRLRQGNRRLALTGRTASPLTTREARWFADAAAIRTGSDGCPLIDGLVGAGLRSLMILPLSARGRSLGVLVCGHAGREQRFTPSDLELGREFARVAAIAIDNALLLDEAERARRAAEAANRGKTDFLSVMSHELRTPLNAILGFAGLLGDEIVAPLAEGQRRPVERITASACHLLEMIEELLDYARLDVGGTGGLRMEVVDLFAVAREAASMVEPSAAIHGLALHVEIPSGARPAVTDGRRVKQILLNLLNNAVRFTERGSVRLRVEDRDAGGRVSFSVEDTGIGIAPEHQDKIFHPFWQVDQSNTRTVGGTGLGLAITRQLAVLLGAELTLRSAPGQGSTFTLLLPAQTAHPAPVR